MTRFIQTSRSSGSLHISFKLTPAHPYTSSNHYRADLPRDPLTSYLACNMAFVRVPFNLTTWLNHMTFLLLTNSNSVSTLPRFLLSARWAQAWYNAPATVFCSNCFQMPVELRRCVSRVHDSQFYNNIEMIRERNMIR